MKQYTCSIYPMPRQGQFPSPICTWYVNNGPVGSAVTNTSERGSMQISAYRRGRLINTTIVKLRRHHPQLTERWNMIWCKLFHGLKYQFSLKLPMPRVRRTEQITKCIRGLPGIVTTSNNTEIVLRYFAKNVTILVLSVLVTCKEVGRDTWAWATHMSMCWMAHPQSQQV